MFIAWVNYHLAPRKIKIANLESDLLDGVVLVTLCEVLLGLQIDVSMEVMFMEFASLKN